LRFSSVKQIGQRGPFDVFSAWPAGGPVEQAVLLYRLRSGFRVDPRQVTAYLADMRSLAEASPPGVWRIMEAGTEEGRLYVMGEYRHATALSSVLGRLVSRGLEVAAVVEILSQVARALLAAHSCPGAGGAVIHGTLGPAQVLLDFDGTVWVRDFALYRLLGERVGGSFGGVLLSPEQKRGARPDQRSDVYSLGRLGQELLLLTSSGEVPEGLTQQLAAMASSEPGKRPASPGEFLEQWQQEAPGGRMALARLGQLLAEQIRRQAGPARTARGSDTASSSSTDDGDLLDPASFWQGADGEEETAEVELEARGLPAAGAAAADPSPAPASESAHPDVRGSPATESPTPGGDGNPVREPGRVSSAERYPRHPQVPERERATRPASARPSSAAGRKEAARRWPVVLVMVLLLAALLALIRWLADGGPAIEQDRLSADGHPAVDGSPERPRPGERTAEANRQAATAEKEQRLDGIFNIVSTPPGAVVYLDGRKQGVTPTVVRKLPLQKRIKVRLELEGYRSWEGEFMATAKEPRREIEAGLFPAEKCPAGTGWLYVSSEPPGATVEVDGRRFPGATPLIINRLCAGKRYTVGLRLPGYLPWRRENVAVVPNQVNNVRAQLTR